MRLIVIDMPAGANGSILVNSLGEQKSLAKVDTTGLCTEKASTMHCFQRKSHINAIKLTHLKPHRTRIYLKTVTTNNLKTSVSSNAISKMQANPRMVRNQVEFKKLKSWLPTLTAHSWKSEMTWCIKNGNDIENASKISQNISEWMFSQLTWWVTNQLLAM